MCLLLNTKLQWITPAAAPGQAPRPRWPQAAAAGCPRRGAPPAAAPATAGALAGRPEPLDGGCARVFHAYTACPRPRLLWRPPGPSSGPVRGPSGVPANAELSPLALWVCGPPAAVGAGDCAVCLAEFERGEEARALPGCGPRFHVDGFDAWFRGPSTGPLCRAAVEAPDDAVARPEVRVDVAADADAAAKGGAPAMSSGTDLDKTRRVSASTRPASF